MKKQKYRFIKGVLKYNVGDIVILNKTEAELLKGYVIEFYTYKELKERLLNDAIKILEDVKQKLIDNDYDGIEKMLEYSPAGDCMGSENHYIDFEKLFANLKIKYGDHYRDGYDLQSVVNKLKEFDEKIKKNGE